MRRFTAAGFERLCAFAPTSKPPGPTVAIPLSHVPGHGPHASPSPHPDPGRLARHAGRGIVSANQAGFLSDALPPEGACTPAQRRLWLVDRLEPGNPALNLAARCRVGGAFPATVLDEAASLLVARHDELRTVMAEKDGQPTPNLAPEARCTATRLDFSELPPPQALARAESEAAREAQTPFDLTRAPLLRVIHIAIGPGEGQLLLTTHQLAATPGGADALLQELLEACRDLAQGHAPARRDEPPREPAPLPPPAADDDEYWVAVLRGLPSFEVAPDHARAPVRSSRGAAATLTVGHDLIGRLRQLSRREGCSLQATVFATALALLQRWCDDEGPVIGISVAGGGSAWTGPYPLHLDLGGAPPFSALMHQLRRALDLTQRHASVSLDRLLELRGSQRDLSRPALFPIHVLYKVSEGDSHHYGPFHAEPLPPGCGGALYDLEFTLQEQGGGWSLRCVYSSDLYEPQTAQRMLRHLCNLLHAVAENPSRTVSELPMLDPEEEYALVQGCNQTAAEYPAHLAVPGLFERRAHAAPESVALRCGEVRMSYRTLDAAANRLAHGLRQRGVGRGQRVAICLPRSPELLVALLAVMKAGAAYVPLDPDYPPGRLEQILSDAKPALTLTSAATRRRLPQHLETWVFDLAAMPGEAWQEQAGPHGTIRPDDIAYVIYTSGSTGRPKGVQVAHGSLVNLLWAMRRTPGMSSDDTLLAVTTVSFDIAGLELFLPLIMGGTIALARETEVADGRALAALLAKHQVSVMQATPATWQLLLDGGWTGTPRLKMLCGGEALSRSLAQRLLPCGAELWNLYGPTETTIWSSAERVRLGPGTGAICLGPPLANTQFYVLDRQRQLLPMGAIGELYIGGDGVAAGYLNLPALTRERFLPDPFRRAPAAPGRLPARLYRTGDRVRRRGADQLEFLGREDQQVKLRGYRIELGEIESVLRAHPQVAEAAALLVRDAAGEPALRACVVPRRAEGGGAIDEPALLQALQAHLRQALPAPLSSAVLRLQPSFPRLPNGKLDRGALALAAAGEAARAGRGEPPTTPTEKRLARLWRPVLGIVGIGRHENFFEIGGHSLLAVRLMVRIEGEFSRRLALADLFQHPTLAQQAQLLDTEVPRPALDFRQVVRLQGDGTRPPLIAINNTGIYFALAKHLGRDQPFTSLQLFDPAAAPGALPTTLPDIAAGYVDLIRRVQPEGPYSLLGWCVAGTLAFEVARQLRAAGHEVSHLFLFDTQAPGHLRRLPWLQACLSDYSYRWKLIAADWERHRHEPHALRDFLANRATVARLRQVLNGPRPAGETPAPTGSPEDYDTWLLRHLETAAESYEPQPYSGPMTLIRSSQEPAGRFIDPSLGWSPFASAGLEVLVVNGDHFSMFQEPGVAALAQRIDATLRAPG